MGIVSGRGPIVSVIISEKHRKIIVPFDAGLANLFKDAQPLTHAGKNLLALHHDTLTAATMSALGYDVPSPITKYYKFPSRKPFDVQLKTCSLLTLNKRAYVLNGMGTGKTSAALWAWDFLYENNLAGKLLVIAPISTLEFTWEREIFEILPHRKVAVLYGTKHKRLQKLANDEIDVYVINHDGVRVIYDDLMLRGDIDTLVIDELAVYRNPGADRTKLMRKMAKHKPRVWGMTGSPTPNSPTDVWAQCQIVTPSTVPTYFRAFHQKLMHKVTEFKYIPKADATEQAFAVMQPAVRYTLDDVVELPALVERTQDIKLGARQAKIYQEIKTAAYAAVANGEITAVNAGAVLNKLLQISCGWVYTKDKQVVSLDNDARIQALVDTIQGIGNKGIVFVPYIHALNGIGEALKAEGIDYATVSGDTPQRERGEIFTKFQTTPEIKILVAHPMCMAHGITLTAADTIVWFSPTTSLETFDQANARIRRIGQKNKQLVLMLQSTEAERKMYKRLREKQTSQNLLLEMFQENS